MKNCGKKKLWIVMVVSIIILLIIDQLAKLGAFLYLQQESKVILSGILKLAYVKNTGVAFSLIQNNPFLIMLMEIIVLTFVIRFLRLQYNRMNLGTKIALTFILAGGTSNFIDRIFHRAVIDYIDISPLIAHFPIFNLADMYIVLGLLLFIVSFAIYGVSQTKSINTKKSVDL